MGYQEQAARRGRGLAIAWRRWQLGLAVWGVVLGVVLVNGDLDMDGAGADRLRAQVGREDHGAPIWSVGFAGTGAGAGRLVSSTITGEVRLKDLPAGRVLRLQGETGSFPLGPASSPDGRTLAIAGRGPAVRLWDTETGVELEPMGGGPAAARSVVFSPDGSVLAVGTWMSEDRPAAVVLWSWPGRRRLAILEGLRGNINALAFSPDGSAAVAADSAGEIAIWDVATGRERVRRRAHEGGITAMAVAPAGRLIATASYPDGIVRLWDARDGAPRGALSDVSTGVSALAFSPDGALLAMARGDGVATLWGVATGREAGSVRVPSGSLQSVAFSGDGRILATGGIDGSVRLWDAGAIVAGGQAAR